MKKNTKKYLKSNLIGFIIGGLLISGVAVYAAITFPSNDVSYENSTSGLKSTNVQGAIDELYETCTTEPSGSDTIEELLPNNPDELYKDEHGDIRYYGKNPNNYISFNNELWRILGVIDGKIKIIRNESIGDMAWDSSSSNNWNNASLKSYLNGEYYNSINETYKNMISNETFYLGGPYVGNYSTLTASGYYNAERDSTQVSSGNPATTTQYIGLMYPSDYGYAAGESCLSTALYQYASSCKNSDYLSGLTEWLQTPYVSASSKVTSLYNLGYVFIDFYIAGSSIAVRPTVYLNSSVQITGGTGTQSNPYTIK